MSLELAWAGGIIDGEGWIGLSASSAGKGRVPCLHVQMCHELTIRKLASILKVGKVYGPYKYGSNRQPYWRLAIDNGPQTEQAIRAVRPYLVTKRNDACLVLRYIHWRKQQPKHWRFTEYVEPDWLPPLKDK